MTKNGVWVRGILYTLIAVLVAAASTDAVLASSWPTIKDWIEITLAGAIALRAFIDTSNADSKKEENP